MTDDPEVRALVDWTAGMAAQLEGRLLASIDWLDAAEARFLAIGQVHTAAATQVSKLITLAMLGRYDEAIACALRARDVFLTEGDMLAAEKIEQKLGNIYHRRDQFSHAHPSHAGRAIIGLSKQNGGGVWGGRVPFGRRPTHPTAGRFGGACHTSRLR